MLSPKLNSRASCRDASTSTLRIQPTRPCSCRPPLPRPRAPAVAAAPDRSPASGLLQFLPSFLGGPDPSEQRLQQDRDRLLTLLLEGGGSNVRKEVDELVTSLADSGLPFDERKLGGGPWVVLHTSGGLQLWKATYDVGKIANRDNAASQDFDPAQRTALNRAEYYGGSLWVSASGTYEPVDNSRSCPKQIQANISSGLLNLWGLQIPLPIRGTGYFEVRYLDNDVRVFKSGTSYAVQVRRAALDDLRQRLLGEA